MWKKVGKNIYSKKVFNFNHGEVTLKIHYSKKHSSMQCSNKDIHVQSIDLDVSLNHLKSEAQEWGRLLKTTKLPKWKKVAYMSDRKLKLSFPNRHTVAYKNLIKLFFG